MDLDTLNFVMIPVLVLERRPDGRFQYIWANKALQDVAGLTFSDLVGRTASDVFPGRVGAMLEQHQQQAAAGQVPYSFSFTINVPKGKKTIDARFYPVVRDGKVEMLVSNHIDRTTESTLHEHRIETDAERAAMLSEVESFISMAAHDLRSPMRSVRTIAGMLREEMGDLDHSKRELIDMLEQTAAKSAELINDVLAFGSAREVNWMDEVFDFGALCADIFTILDPHHRHELNCVQRTVMVDRVVMQVAVRNLVDNAIKHAGTDHVCLDVSLRQDGADQLEVVVADNGRGFGDPAMAFLDGGEFRYGTGFGLLGVRRIVASRNGRIWATNSERNSGAEIHFTLPGRIIDDAADGVRFDLSA